MSIDNFVGRFKGGARPSMYKCFIDRVPDQNFEFLCKAAQIPGRSTGEILVPYLNRKISYPGDPAPGDWTLTITNDSDFVTRDLFDAWSNNINAQNEITGSTDAAEIFSRASVIQLDRDGSVLKEYTLYNVWPAEIAPIELGFETTDTIEEYSVTLKYSHFDVK
jgi:hypothetical protein